MPTPEKREQRRQRTQRVLSELEREITDAARDGREPDSGKILSTLKWEIAARAEATEAVEDLAAGALVVIQEISNRQTGAITDLSEIRKEVAALSTLVRNAESSRAEYAKTRNEADVRRDANLDLIAGEVRSLAGAVGELYETQGRLLVELATRARHDSIHEEEITGVKTAVVKVKETADKTQRDLAVAQAKALGSRALAVALGWGIVEAIRHWLGV